MNGALLPLKTLTKPKIKPRSPQYFGNHLLTANTTGLFSILRMRSICSNYTVPLTNVL